MLGVSDVLRVLFCLRSKGICGAHGCGKGLSTLHLTQLPHERSEFLPIDSAIAVYVSANAISLCISSKLITSSTFDCSEDLLLIS